MTRQVEAGSGFASEAMLPVHFGLGNAARIDWVEINWPSGLTQRFDGAQLDPFIDRMVQIEEGSGRMAEVTPAHAKARPMASTHQAKRDTL
jgi:enediyne biosynthesis protein E4